MYIGYTEEHERLRKELRAYYDRLLTPEIQEAVADSEGVGPAVREIVEKVFRIGSDGRPG